MDTETFAEPFLPEGTKRCRPAIDSLVRDWGTEIPRCPHRLGHHFLNGSWPLGHLSFYPVVWFGCLEVKCLELPLEVKALVGLVV